MSGDDAGLFAGLVIWPGRHLLWPTGLHHMSAVEAQLLDLEPWQ